MPKDIVNQKVYIASRGDWTNTYAENNWRPREYLWEVSYCAFSCGHLFTDNTCLELPLVSIIISTPVVLLTLTKYSLSAYNMPE